MTDPDALDGTIVTRQWDRSRGLVESVQAFHTIAELYRLCLAAEVPDVIDRIVIRGQDERGHPRVVTFTFQSITVSPQTAD